MKAATTMRRAQGGTYRSSNRRCSSFRANEIWSNCKKQVEQNNTSKHTACQPHEATDCQRAIIYIYIYIYHATYRVRVHHIDNDVTAARVSSPLATVLRLATDVPALHLHAALLHELDVQTDRRARLHGVAHGHDVQERRLATVHVK